MRKLGGWWRIWVVVTAGLLAYAIYYSSWNNDLEVDGKPSFSCIPGTAEAGTRFNSVWVKNPHFRPRDSRSKPHTPSSPESKLPSMEELLVNEPWEQYLHPTELPLGGAKKSGLDQYLDDLDRVDSSGRQIESGAPKSYEEELNRRRAVENAYKMGDPLDRYFEEEKNGFPSKEMIEKRTPISIYRCVSWVRLADNLGYVAFLSIFLIFAARIAKWIVEGFNK